VDKGPVTGLTPRRCRLAGLLLGLLAVLAALWSPLVLFDLRPGRYGDAMALFQTGQAEVEIDARAPEARVPYILPGPADGWAGGRAHSVRIRHAESATGRLRLELHAAETHHEIPPRLLIAAEGWQVRRQFEPGTGLPPPHRDRGRRHVYRVRVPAPEAAGPWILTLTNEDGSWVMWERIRLVEARATPAWAHLGLAGPLPWPSAALLAGSLVLLGVAAALTERARGWTGALIGLGGPAVALAVAALLLVVARGEWLPFQPRWLSLALPGFFLVTATCLGRHRDSPAGGVRAWLGGVLDLGLGLAVTHLAVLLLNGGYRATVAGVAVDSPRLAAAVILLAALAVLRLALRAGATGVLRRHPAALLFAAVLVVYLANGRTISSWDTRPARYAALSILREADFDLDEFVPAGATPPGYMRAVSGRYLSAYPVGISLVALPFYLPAAVSGLDPDTTAGDELEKVAAATLVALSAVLLYVTTRRVSGGVTAVVVALVYALASSSLSASSQALWQHTAAQLALAAALYGFVRARAAPGWLALAGAAVAFAVVARPANLLLAAPFTLYALGHHRPHAWRFALGALLPAAFQCWYDLAYFGSLFHPRLPVGYSAWQADAWDSPLLEGLAGVLLSPGRGLFVYSPVFLFSVLGLALAWRKGGDPLLRYGGVGSVLLVCLYAKWRLWHGGPVFGPRLLADLSPLLAFALYPLRDLAPGRWPLRAVFVATVACSVAAHSIGAFYDDWRWTYCTSYEVLRDRLWSWRDNQLVSPIKHALVTLSGRPTSETHRGPLAARYATDARAPLGVGAESRVRLAVTARNEGPVVWRAATYAPDRGVALRWHWRREPDGDPSARGRALLCADTFPGEEASFHILAPAPEEAGVYVLELGLTSGPATLEALGPPPLRLLATVSPPDSS
jgi:hypothetical protein